MTMAMITFFTSFGALIVMMWLKSIELKRGAKFAFTRILEKMDHRVETVYNNIRTFISYFNRKSAIALAQWIAFHVLSWARRAYIWMHRKAHAHPPSKKVIDMVRGRGEVETKGGASFYFKRIGEDGGGMIN